MDYAKQKTLILYASAGHGHEKAARAIEEACRRLYPEEEITCYDILRCSPSFFGNGYKNTYLFLIRYFPWLWGFLYEMSDRRWLYTFIAPLRRLVNGFFAKDLERMIRDVAPQALVSTHFQSTEVGAFLKTHGHITSKFITVITDFLPHTFWVEKAVDFYAVGLPETRRLLIQRGVPAEKIRVTGIPVAQKFSIPVPKSEARRRLGLEENPFTVLITSGGAGIGSTRQLVASLRAFSKELQMAVVCGTNRRLFQTLSAQFGRDVRCKILGFVNNMDEWMDACDVVVGKAGGLTVSESLAKGRPMVFFESVPGQETRNASCLDRHGACFEAASAEGAAAIVRDLMSQPQKLRFVERAVKELAHPLAAVEIAKLAHE